MKFFLGGYSSDLNVCRLDPEDGSMEIVGTVATPENASFVKHVPQLSAVYVAVETGYRTKEAGLIAAYRVDEEGGLTPIGTASSCGTGPCHVDVDPQRKILAAANYGGENFGLVRLEDDGTLGERVACVQHHGSSANPRRQAEPHPHATYFSPDRRFLFVCDLGTDRLMRYDVQALLDGRGEEAGVPAAELTPGSGPRHLSFSADGGYLYLVNELSSDIAVYTYAAADGSLTRVQLLSTLPKQFQGASTAAEIEIHPAGRYLYVSNRGHDSIAVFDRSETDGTIALTGTFPTTGEGPRHFQIDPSGRFLLVSNQFSDRVVSFELDAETGMGSPTGKSLSVPSPACTEFLR